jgi:RimJ/RimL family protein N-acetyltransferase
VILETARLTLTPVTPADAPLVHPIMADPDVMAHWDVAEIEDPDVVDQILAGQVEAMQGDRAFHWAMRLTADGAFLGLCDLSEIDWRHHRAEVGFILGKDSWGQGYAYEAMQAVMNHAASLGLKRLWARTLVGNDSSEKLLTKLGFEQEGYLRGHVDRDGERRDCRLWGLLL